VAAIALVGAVAWTAWLTAAASSSVVADAAQAGDREAVRSLLKQAADVNASQPDGMTALHWAAMRNDVELATLLFERYEKEARRTLEAGLVIPAYESTLACSHQFNILDARGAVSATDRVGLIRRVRDLACACARAYVGRDEAAARPEPEPEPAAV